MTPPRPVNYRTAMDPNSVVDHFGGVGKMCRALNVSREALRKWRMRGRVPRGRAYEIQVLTGGALRVDPSVYERPGEASQ